jgi:hypothetical protein
MRKIKFGKDSQYSLFINETTGNGTLFRLHPDKTVEYTYDVKDSVVENEYLNRPLYLVEMHQAESHCVLHWYDAPYLKEISATKASWACDD